MASLSMQRLLRYTASAMLAATLSDLAAKADVSITAYELSRAMGTIIESPAELKPVAHGTSP